MTFSVGAGGTPSAMPAKPIAAIGRSYKCPQADRRDYLQFAARQRGVWTTGDLLQKQQTPHSPVGGATPRRWRTQSAPQAKASRRGGPPTRAASTAFPCRRGRAAFRTSPRRASRSDKDSRTCNTAKASRRVGPPTRAASTAFPCRRPDPGAIGGHGPLNDQKHRFSREAVLCIEKFAAKAPPTRAASTVFP
jgi:hypothetical protein